jgi:membrane protease YdiL (CAAX protease family)
MFIHIIRGLAIGLTATALIGTGAALYAQDWVTALFAACALGLFAGITRLLWTTSSRPGAMSAEPGPFHSLSGKLLLALLFGGFVVGGAVSVAVDALITAPTSGYGAAALGYGLYGFIALGLWDATRRHRVDFRRIRGVLPERRVVVKSITTVIPLLLFSYGTVWIIYYPLSVLAPELVESLLLSDDIIAQSADGTLALGPNALSAVALILVAPITEEVFFRGYLLHRWAVTWGVRSSVVATTVVFASLHADPLGALLFGFALAVIYLKTRSLVLVIMCHILNNLLAYTIGVGFTVLFEEETAYTVLQFQGEWWTAAIALALSLPWAIRFVRRYWPDETWRLPYN